jgi:hypothetical protein
MLEYRITKYDPQFRDASGAYMIDEWTCYGDADGSAALNDDLQVEANYVNVAAAFLIEAGIGALAVCGLEHARQTLVSFAEAAVLLPDQWEAAFRAVLREDCWCRFEAVDSFVHFGWDCYMYLGAPRMCPKAIALAGSRRLFVEEYSSPYRTVG